MDTTNITPEDEHAVMATMVLMQTIIYGEAIGDALGVPYEFRERGTFTCTGMVGGGAHRQPAGTYSDDTALMLATLDSLLSCDGTVNEDDMRVRFLAWLDDGKYSADGTVRYDALSQPPKVGDKVTLYGVLVTYNGYSGSVPEMKNAWLMESSSASQ